jgi:hypothetical protein
MLAKSLWARKTNPRVYKYFYFRLLSPLYKVNNKVCFSKLCLLERFPYRVLFIRAIPEWGKSVAAVQCHVPTNMMCQSICEPDSKVLFLLGSHKELPSE